MSRDAQKDTCLSKEQIIATAKLSINFKPNTLESQTHKMTILLFFNAPH